MSAASELIEQMEADTGQRIDDNDGDNLAITGLLGAMSRMMGKSPDTYTEQDDVAAGLLIQNPKPELDEMIANLLLSGMSPDDIKSITG